LLKLVFEEMNFEYNGSDDEDDDDLIARQAQEAAAKYG
jgi:hypothetical protein